MNIRFKNYLSILAILLLMPFSQLNAAPSAEAGKTLFTNYCASCHAKNMKTALTGPALGGSEAKWDSKANLYEWIRNSQGMIAKGHPRAVELWNQYKPTVMTAFPKLTDDEIGSILMYIDGVYTGKIGGAPKPTSADAVVGEPKKDNKWIYIGLVAALALLALVLSRTIGFLNQMAAEKEGRPYVQKSLVQTLTSKSMITFLIFAGVVLGGYTTVNRAINLGRQAGYEPDQPIKFSHATHAGVHKIDCQYCHDSARKSKHSSIPGANTCMNCHRAINVGSKYGTAEITKIYASIGYNPNTNTYIENYESYPDDSIKAVYTKWIGDKLLESSKANQLDAAANSIVEDQWKDIVASLTNAQKKKIQGPIEWIRINNLPDHAYFNHAQHVAIGKVECQTCHGPIEKMEVVSQHTPLSMGWCINCHRNTEVKFKDNEFYKSYATFHEELKAGKRDKVTVSDIGGLECQKCHY